MKENFNISRSGTMRSGGSLHCNLLKSRFEKFLKTNKGTDAKLNDPSNPKNWQAVQTSDLKFVDSPEYAKYMSKIKQIKTEFRNFDKII